MERAAALIDTALRGYPFLPPPQGVPRAHAVEWSAATSRRDDNRIRRSAVCALQRGRFGGAVDLAVPALNSHTVWMAAVNAASGEMTVEALDPVPGAGPLPRVVARRELRRASAGA